MVKKGVFGNSLPYVRFGKGENSLLVFSDGLHHVATAVHLANPPKNSLPNYLDFNVTYNEEKYYYAETGRG